ncbi:hypothetical protein [Arthrobacter sp. lap29]|uniref:hypothetical protein n=1 Tax=Arthrobacter sp. lap29 TaxID=3056122 RepID=UPI0028F6C68F|nr:hypothetical protein [Arthrobacter sp. lap29]
MELEIDWREPPLSGEAKLQTILKHHAGRWARVKKNMASSTASSAWRKAGFQTEVHPVEGTPKRYDIYARWPERSAETMPGASATPAAVASPQPPAPTTAGKTTPVTTKDGVPVKDPAPADASDLQIPTSGAVTGGYLASRTARAVAAGGAKEVKLVGHNPSPVRP